MNDTRARSMLAAKDSIERTLIERGVELDAQGRESIGWALKALTEDDGFSLDAAVHRILDVHRRACANAA
jgi:hypothetical protein